MVKLFKHQVVDAALVVASPHLPNYSTPGTGKTYTTLEAIQLARYKTGVIVAPLIALPMWKECIESYLGKTVKILKGGGTSFVLPTGVQPDFYVVSYGTVINSRIKGFLMEIGYEALVLDESHALKTPTSKRTMAIYGHKCDGVGGLFSVAKCTYPLTGTPIVRHNNDMWSQLRAAFPGVLKKYDALEYRAFMGKFCVTQVKKHHPRMQPKLEVVASKNSAELNVLLFHDIGAIRRQMDEVAKDMPPLTFRNYVVPVKRSTIMSAILHGMSDSDIEAALVAEDAGMSKAYRMLGVLKAESVGEYVVESCVSGPVVVGYWHTSVGEAIAAYCEGKGLSVGIVGGATPMGLREDYRERFNAGDLDVIVGQMGAMGVSWSLNKCGHHVVIAEDSFSPSTIEQFIKRVWRIGQARHVQVDFIHADHVIDEAIVRVRERKEKSNKIVMGD